VTQLPAVVCMREKRRLILFSTGRRQATACVAQLLLLLVVHVLQCCAPRYMHGTMAAAGRMRRINNLGWPRHRV
jgi:hypothetical protein